MNGYQYIMAKQIAWASNCGLTLVGSKGLRGKPAYTPALNQNLFQPLLPEVRESFEAGDGSELGKLRNPVFKIVNTVSDDNRILRSF